MGKSEMPGAYALVIAPLCYLQSSAQIPAHFDRLNTYLPIALYNNPAIALLPGTNILPDALAVLQGRFCAIKDSSGRMEILRSYLPYATVYQGNEGAILDALDAGARGAVGSMGNISVLPQLLCDPATPRPQAVEIQRRISELRLPLTASLTKIPAGLKVVAALLGVCGDTVAPKTPAMDDQEIIRVEEVIDALVDPVFASVAEAPLSAGFDVVDYSSRDGHFSDEIRRAQRLWRSLPRHDTRPHNPGNREASHRHLARRGKHARPGIPCINGGDSYGHYQRRRIPDVPQFSDFVVGNRWRMPDPQARREKREAKRETLRAGSFKWAVLKLFEAGYIP